MEHFLRNYNSTYFSGHGFNHCVAVRIGPGSKTARANASLGCYLSATDCGRKSQSADLCAALSTAVWHHYYMHDKHRPGGVQSSSVSILPSSSSSSSSTSSVPVVPGCSNTKPGVFNYQIMCRSSSMHAWLNLGSAVSCKPSKVNSGKRRHACWVPTNNTPQALHHRL